MLCHILTNEYNNKRKKGKMIFICVYDVKILDDYASGCFNNFQSNSVIISVGYIYVVHFEKTHFLKISKISFFHNRFSYT